MKKFIMLMMLMLATLAHASADDDREAYAVFDNGTLTFYCDNQTRSGAMPLNEGDYAPAWKNNASDITTVEFSESFQYALPTTCYQWFDGCKNLTEIKDIKYLNTAKVTNMRSMFMGCESLESLDLSSFNTEKVTNMSYMFASCHALESLDLSSFNTEKVTNMSYMFANCSALETILVGSGWNVDEVTSSDKMFAFCGKLVGGAGCIWSSKTIDNYYARIDRKGIPGYLTSLEQCTPYAELIDNPDGETKTLVFRFGYKPDNAMSLNEGNADPDWQKSASKITIVEFDPLFKYARPTSCCEWFNGCTKLTEIKGIEYLNTSEVTLMTNMFNGCHALKSLDLSSFNTAKVTDMNGMFAYCTGLRSLDLSSFNTENVTNMNEMFHLCSALTSLDLSSFNTAHVTDMSYMFSDCSVLKTILVGSGWNVDWVLDKVTSSFNMFSYCPKLVGGNGFLYEESMNNVYYAFIDGKDGNPGYLTLNALTLTNENGKTTAVLNGDFTDGSGAALIIDKEIKVDELTFNRSFTNGVTATVMFPFGFTAGNNIKGTFHTITKVGPDDNGVWTAELSNAITDIKANTPYIFYPSEDIDAITFSNITLVPTDGTLTNGDANGWQLHGVYSKKIWQEDSKTEYGFAAEKVEDDGIEAGEFVLAGKDAWADPLRCYLTYKNGETFTAKAATVLPDRIRVVFPSGNDDEITTDPAEVITPVSSVSEPSDVKVWSFGGTVFIESQPDMDYTIIDLSGRIIKKGVTRSTREEVTLSRHAGIVIVNINGKSVKVNL